MTFILFVSQKRDTLENCDLFACAASLPKLDESSSEREWLLIYLFFYLAFTNEVSVFTGEFSFGRGMLFKVARWEGWRVVTVDNDDDVQKTA